MSVAPGTYSVGVQKEGYVPQVKSSVVVTSGKTTQVDFSLRKAKILVYDDGEHHFATEALTNLGYPFTETNDFTAFNDAMAAQGWQLIVVDDPSDSDTDFLTNIENFVKAGGHLAISTWQSDSSPAHTLWGALGSTSGAAPDGDVYPIYRWVAAHPIFSTPNDVPDFTALSDAWYGVSGPSNRQKSRRHLDAVGTHRSLESPRAYGWGSRMSAEGQGPAALALSGNVVNVIESVVPYFRGG